MDDEIANTIVPTEADDSSGGAVDGTATHRVTADVDLVIVDVTTGDHLTLVAVVAALPVALPVPVAIVQSLPPAFTAMLMQRLGRRCSIPVAEARHGGRADGGHIYVVPGGRHLSLKATRSASVIVLSDAPPRSTRRPTVDVVVRHEGRAGWAVLTVPSGVGGPGHRMPTVVPLHDLARVLSSIVGAGRVTGCATEPVPA